MKEKCKKQQKKNKQRQKKARGSEAMVKRVTIASVPLAPKNCSYCYDMNSTSF